MTTATATNTNLLPSKSKSIIILPVTSSPSSSYSFSSTLSIQSSKLILGSGSNSVVVPLTSSTKLDVSSSFTTETQSHSRSSQESSKLITKISQMRTGVTTKSGPATSSRFGTGSTNRPTRSTLTIGPPSQIQPSNDVPNLSAPLNSNTISKISPSPQTNVPMTQQQEKYIKASQSNNAVPLVDSNGKVQAYVVSTSDELLYLFRPSDDSTLISSILDLITSNGRPLSKTISLCFVVPDNFTAQETTENKLDCKKTKRNGCLAFNSNETQEWECEDRSLQERTINEQNVVCGDTPHLTSFAILLSSSTVSSGLCQTPSKTLLWVSLALLILVMITSAVVILLFIVNQTCTRLVYGNMAYEGVEFKRKFRKINRQAIDR
eukprot:TRINITY_DN5110_c0_g2_i1.p1 TRINITY_DN5110_c0_g2~~TRINITY_DN5110_c0_g2_i1.p1  ORF type:complete len:397 (-),score=53.28 TRINITY_DN5110_c0_g2_i1:42-1175(-)